jgi:hypothetical protein
VDGIKVHFSADIPLNQNLVLSRAVEENKRKHICGRTGVIEKVVHSEVIGGHASRAWAIEEDWGRNALHDVVFYEQVSVVESARSVTSVELCFRPV